MAATYYDRLGVSPDASRDEIEHAYRERLKRTHPAVSDDPDAAARTKVLMEARAVLTDEAERSRYDRLGHDRYVEYHDSFVEPDEDDVAAAGPAETLGGEHRWDFDESDDSAGSELGSVPDPRGPSVDHDRARRRARIRESRADVNPAGGDADGPGTVHREWHASDSEVQHQVYPADRSGLGSRLFPPGPSTLLLALAFALYPVLLWAALTPRFPLAVNLVVGACVVLVVAFLQSMPAVGVLVFGFWTVVLPVALALGLGVPVPSTPWLLALGATALPLGLSALTWAALRA